MKRPPIDQVLVLLVADGTSVHSASFLLDQFRLSVHLSVRGKLEHYSECVSLLKVTTGLLIGLISNPLRPPLPPNWRLNSQPIISRIARFP